MTSEQLLATITTPYCTTLQVQKLFPLESFGRINMQLSRMVRRGSLVRLKRGVFVLPGFELDEFFLANILYPQSYVSLESALNTYGMIPDVPAQVTSVTPLTPEVFKTTRGTFSYSKCDSSLYFGFQLHALSGTHQKLSGLSYRLAEPEKALLDYIYIRRIKNLEEQRVSLAETVDIKKLREYAKQYPTWVQKVVL